MRRVLDAKTAVIHTAQVEVKTLTISGKQVTLSVFRQLPEKDLLQRDYLWADEDYGFESCLDGTPWGIVRYYWGEYTNDKGYYAAFHVVWQEHDSLFRQFLHARGPYYELEFASSTRPTWSMGEIMSNESHDEQLKRREAHRRWVNFMKYCAVLPQLFIAV